MKKTVLISIVFCVFLAGITTGIVAFDNTKNNYIEEKIAQLEDNNVASDSDGLLILKRYKYYIDEISKGNAFSRFVDTKVSPVYNFQAFSNMSYKDSIQTIVKNTKDGKDAFYGMTGLFERAYISETDNKIDSYIIYLPSNYDQNKKYPLIVLLHGYGEPAYLPINISAHDNFLKACETNEVIMVAPNGKNKTERVSGYLKEGEKDVLQVISLVEKAYNIDKGRVYLTGLSMGGYGTWYIGTRHSDLFAAIAPISAYGTKKFASNAAKNQNGWTVEPIDVRLLKNTPAYVWHGDQDDRIPVTESRELVMDMKNAGLNVKYEELKEVKHDAADHAYDGDTVIKWFLQHSKS